MYLSTFNRDRLAAYGFLSRVLEIIAERMSAKEGSLKCYATYSITEWSRLLECHTNAVNKYMPYLALIGWVTVESEGRNYTVNIPKMVEWRDEATRKSGVLPEQVAQSRADKNKEEERESRDDGSLSGSSAGREKDRTPPHDFEVTPDLRQWASKECHGVDAAAETAKFKVYEQPRPVSDWVAKWKSWMLRAKEHLSTKPHLGKLGDGVQPEFDIDYFARLLGMNMRDGENTSEFRARVEQANNRRIESLSGLETIQ
jgi:hypothetical protein